MILDSQFSNTERDRLYGLPSVITPLCYLVIGSTRRRITSPGQHSRTILSSPNDYWPVRAVSRPSLYNYIVIDAHARHGCTARRHYSHLPNVLCARRADTPIHRDKHTRPNQTKAIERQSKRTNFHIGTNLTFQNPTNKIELKEQLTHRVISLYDFFFPLNFISMDGIDSHFDLISSWCHWKFSTHHSQSSWV